jgi:hypothetical protein
MDKARAVKRITYWRANAVRKIGRSRLIRENIVREVWGKVKVQKRIVGKAVAPREEDLPLIHTGV